MIRKLSLLIIPIIISTGLFAQSPNSFKYQAIARNNNGNIIANQQVELNVSIIQGDVNGTEIYTETHDSTTNAYGLVNLNIGSGNPTNFASIDWSSGPYFIKVSMDGTVMGTTQLLSVPYALHSKTTESYSETDPEFNSSEASNITSVDINNWNGKLDSYTEIDPEFNSSVAGSITETDTAYWNNKLDSYSETDPEFSNSVASEITVDDTTNWNHKLDAEVDGSTSNEIQNLSDVLAEGNDANALKIQNLADPSEDQDAATKAYVDFVKEQIFLEFEAEEGVTDIDGNYYDAVVVGLQIWMASNLKVTKYADGTPITLVSDDATWLNLAVTDQAYCYYYDDNTLYNGGALYSWAAARNGSTASNTAIIQGVCPDGWHLPTDEDWQELYDYVSGSTIVLKASEGWCSSGNGTDDYGLHIGPGGGQRSWYNGASTGGCNASFWSSYNSDGTNAIMYRFFYNSGTIERANFPKKTGNSVRCIKD